eukprot:gb/GFBE01052597.1/.p1 GENE.gb/GFBE01052597.1/~~gb/GFBE01052597.1/.p1  ORF type:complete len:479 (+),score=60.02 gb/GFBE01052597.1/:1-1437(+)
MVRIEDLDNDDLAPAGGLAEDDVDPASIFADSQPQAAPVSSQMPLSPALAAYPAAGGEPACRDTRYDSRQFRSDRQHGHDRHDRQDGQDRPRRDFNGREPRHNRGPRVFDEYQKEKASKALSLILRHRKSEAMRRDGFLPWDVVLQCPELRRFSSAELVEAIGWSHDRERSRRFEMAFDLTGEKGIWVRALMRHSNGADANLLPPSVNASNRTEKDREAMEMAKRYQPPHRQIYAQPQQQEPMGAASADGYPVSGMPMGPVGGLPAGGQPVGYQRREDIPIGGVAPPEPRPLPTASPVPPPATADASQPSMEPAGAEAMEQIPDLTADLPFSPALVEQPVLLQPPEEKPLERACTNGAQSTDASDGSNNSEGSETRLSQTSLRSPSAAQSAWPPEGAACIGRAVGAFDGEAWSLQNPDDNNNYISFLENDEVARLSHDQDADEFAKEAEARWAFGVTRSKGVPGWFPYDFVKFTEGSA